MCSSVKCTVGCVVWFQDGLLIENMHDVPYVCDSGPEVCAVMTVVCSAVKKLCPALPVGVQVLAANNQTALAIALASGQQHIITNNNNDDDDDNDMG